MLRLEIKHNKKKTSTDIDWMPTKHRWRAVSVAWKVTSTEAQTVQIKLTRGDRVLGYLEVPISHFFSSTHKWFSFIEKKDNLKVSPGAKNLLVTLREYFFPPPPCCCCLRMRIAVYYRDTKLERSYGR